MPVRVDLLDQSAANPARLIEDLAATLPLLHESGSRNRPLHPSLATLEELGSAFLRQPHGLAFTGLCRLPGFKEVVDSWLYPVLFDTARLSYLLVGVIVGRPDLRGVFVREGQWDWPAAVRWLVLHGIRELKLLPYLSSRFVDELRAHSIFLADRLVSPLEYCVLGERPDVRYAFENEPAAAFHDYFDQWLITSGVKDYNLSWLLTEREHRRFQERHNAFMGGVTDGRPIADWRERITFGPANEAAAPHRAQASRSGYRSFGTDYPFLFLDLSDRDVIANAFAGSVRPVGDSGVEIEPGHFAVQLAVSRYASMRIYLDLVVPETYREGLWIKFEIEDHLERVISAASLTGEMVTIPVTFWKPAMRLHLSFARDTDRSGGFSGSTALLRSFGVWQVRL